MKNKLLLLFSLILLGNIKTKAQAWSYVGTPEISVASPTSSQAKIFYDANGVLHVGYIKGPNIYILKFDNNTWSTVSHHVLNRTPNEVDYAIDSNGDIYFAYQATYSFQKMYRVKKFSGGNWSYLGDSIVSYNTTTVDLAIANSEIYFMGNRNVHHWDNINTVWQNIHSVPSGSQFAGGILGVDASQNLHIIHCSNITFTTTYYLMLEKYDGVNWTGVGDTVGVPNALYLHLMFNNSNDPIVAYLTSAGLTPNHNIIHYNGTSWQDIGNIASTPNASIFSVTLNTLGQPLFTSSDYGGKVYEFDGSSYEKLDSATVSGGLLQIMDLSVHPTTGKRYILINELNASSTAAVLSVMEYDENAVGINDIINTTEIKLTVYPNPASEKITLPNQLNGSIVIIKDLSGKTIINNILSGDVNIQGLTPGIYFVQVSSKDGSVLTTKFIKQ